VSQRILSSTTQSGLISVANLSPLSADIMPLFGDEVSEFGGILSIVSHPRGRRCFKEIQVELLAIVTILALIQLLIFANDVGKARMRTGISAPAMTGDPDFERHQRVHQNTIEQLIIFLPSLWLFGQYFDPRIAAALGVVYIIGRFMYRAGYVADPAKRHNGFMVGVVATAILLLGGLVGAVWKLIA
jgi:uncharacterized MAPEG superfamily protein